MRRPCSTFDIPSPLTSQGKLRPGGDQINDREDDDPDDVHKVPVQSHKFDCHGILRVDSSSKREREQGEEHQDTNSNVRAVETGEHIER